MARVTNLRPDDTEQNPFWYTFSVQCTRCREVHPKNVSFNRFVRASSSLEMGLFTGNGLTLGVGAARDER